MMALFLSTFINKLDKKGRVSVPAPFRAALPATNFQGIVVFRSYKHPALEACTLDRMERLSASLDELELFSDAQEDLAASIFADVHQLAFDSEGRILLPKELIGYAQILETVAFVGRGTTFQLWEPDTFKAYQNEARQRMKQQQTTLKLLKVSPNEQ